MEGDRIKRGYPLFKEVLEKYFFPINIIKQLDNLNYTPKTDKCLDAFLKLTTKYSKYKHNKINLSKLSKIISPDTYLIDIVNKGTWYEYNKIKNPNWVEDENLFVTVLDLIKIVISYIEKYSIEYYFNLSYEERNKGKYESLIIDLDSVSTLIEDIINTTKI